MVNPAIISAGAAVIGAANVVHNAASADSGFQVGTCHVHYPQEFPTDMFAHRGHPVEWDIIKFHAHGTFWDNDLLVSCSGYISQDAGPLLGRPDSDHPNVPVNRFAVLSFNKSGSTENMSHGLLTVNIEPWGGGHIVEEPADNPWIALRVSGRFDPVGPGDTEYSFQLHINTHGQIHVSNPHSQAGPFQLAIAAHGNHVMVHLNQL